MPFALVNLEYAAEGSFTDPGKPDHQTATLDLDDGPIISSSEFDLFSDAFGGVLGKVREGHTYSAPGNYTIRLEVTDDDAGRAAASSSFEVFSPTEALLWVVDQIRALESATTNARIKSALSDARFKLVGNPKGSPRNGAIQELANGDPVAALVKIGAAITALESSNSGRSSMFIARQQERHSAQLRGAEFKISGKTHVSSAPLNCAGGLWLTTRAINMRLLTESRQSPLSMLSDTL